MSDWVDIRRQARRDIHAAFSVFGDYVDSTMTAPVTLNIRWQDKLTNAVGDISGGEYARVFENIDRLVFDVAQLAEKAVTLRRGGSVVFPDYDSILFILDALEPIDGPVTRIWTVIRQNADFVVADTNQPIRIRGYMIFVDSGGGLSIRAPDGSIIPLIGG